jgi:hypothetical protein
LHPNVLLPAITSLLGFVFAGVLLLRFARRRQPYYLVWTLGLLWYALADGSEALGGALGWTSGLYRLWYASGAIGVAAYLGAGTLFLHRHPSFGSLTVLFIVGGAPPVLATGHVEIGLVVLGVAMLLTIVLTWCPKWFAHAVFATLLIASAVAAAIVFTAPVDLSLLPASPDQVVSGQAFGPETRALTPPFNIAGALVLVLGAALSAWHFSRTRTAPARVMSNVLIAIGAFVPSLASGLTRFGVTSLFFAGELIGLVCILAGFLLSGSPSSSATGINPSSAAPPRCR